jgi:hypothetical protein
VDCDADIDERMKGLGAAMIPVAETAACGSFANGAAAGLCPRF